MTIKTGGTIITIRAGYSESTEIPTDKLLPCPFCGGVPHLMHVAYPEIKRVDYVVMCEYCGAETHTFKQREPAVKAWNRRK